MDGKNFPEFFYKIFLEKLLLPFLGSVGWDRSIKNIKVHSQRFCMKALRSDFSLVFYLFSAPNDSPIELKKDLLFCWPSGLLKRRIMIGGNRPPSKV